MALKDFKEHDTVICIRPREGLTLNKAYTVLLDKAIIGGGSIPYIIDDFGGPWVCFEDTFKLYSKAPRLDENQDGHLCQLETYTGFTEVYKYCKICDKKH